MFVNYLTVSFFKRNSYNYDKGGVVTIVKR